MEFPRTTTRRATRFAALASAAAIVAIAPACSLLDDEPARDDEGQITEEGDLSAFSIQEGDCLDDPSDLTGVVQDVAAVPCDQPHGAEVYELFDLPDGDYPPADEITTAATDGCSAAFEEAYGDEPGAESIEISYLTPTQESWDQADDREVVCIAISDFDGSGGGAAEGTDGTEAE